MIKPKRELDDSRIIDLAAQILEPGFLVRAHIIGMIEGVKNVGEKSCLQPLSGFEVLVQRNVCFPGPVPRHDALALQFKISTRRVSRMMPSASCCGTLLSKLRPNGVAIR
jgi:hypothetical protein